MKMNQMRWIFSLTALATLAIVGLQAYIWRQGIQQERERFSSSLHHAVYEAAEEFMRPLDFSFRIADGAAGDTIVPHRPGLIALQIGNVDSTLAFSPADMDTLSGRMAFIGSDALKRAMHVLEDSLSGSQTVVLSDTLAHRVLVRHKQSCPSCMQGVSQLSGENFKPLLEAELTRLEIETDFQWGIRHLGDWLIVDGDSTSLSRSAWQFPFFSFGGVERTFEISASTDSDNSFTEFSHPIISLHFPGEHWHLLRSIGPTLLTSSLLALLVLGCIGYAVYVILRQKQLSEIKTDFINNMTHEFKTPISTISLACEALQDVQVTLPPASRQHYLEMIAAENDRLATQVEKVLQMALLDKKDLGLKFERVNVHQLLGELIDAFSLQLQQRKGTISMVLNAHRNTVEGDLMHLRQMFANLLDNANKYSPEAPEIKIETKAVDAGIEIAIHDNGRGISRDALRKIFDRFYRVPTGNLHDVKGFGLGLSYVQTMALAHGGHVHATSKPGFGSSFYLFLPYVHG